MSTLYEDTPLHIDASTNIRLLEIIQADDETAPIACTLCVIALQESPKYTALSYVWGPPTPARDILVNGKPVTVRENLWNFLHQARKDRATCALWIDAICIDQDSNPERTHQVSMMGKIYSEAGLVLVWLGTATKYSAQWERAMKTIPPFHNDGHGNFKRWYKVYGPCVMNFFNSPYWSRAWIVQEYTLARERVLRFGPYTSTGESVSFLCKTWGGFLETHGVKKRPHFMNSMAIRVIDESMEVARGSLKLVELVSSFGLPGRALHCADRRDRVYSLLALCDPQQLTENCITPDYSKSLLELYNQLVRMVINDETWKDVKSALIGFILPVALRLEENELEDLDHDTMGILKDPLEQYTNHRSIGAALSGWGSERMGLLEDLYPRY